MSESGDEERDVREGDADGALGPAVLERLRDGETRTTIGDLAEDIADTEEYEETHERLFDEVLPDLHEDEELSFDRERGTVATRRRRAWERLRSAAAPRTVLPFVLLLSLPALPHAQLDPVPFVGAGLVAVVFVSVVIAVLE